MNKPTQALGQVEFIALMAMLAALVAFSIDAMLPALDEIADDLSPDAPNLAQLILTSFVLGMGLGTFFAGPLSDRFGRKPVVVGGVVIYIIAAAVAWAAPSLELMLAARLVQGLGASGPRVVALAIVRDVTSGRTMARTVSFVMMVFSLVPALAPTLGAGIIHVSGWRSIFMAFVVFALIVMTWLIIRQPETLKPENRRPLSIAALASGTREMLSHPTARLSILVQTLCFGILFLGLSTTQQTFDITYGWGETFHYWFGGIAILAVSASIINARLVGRLGMRAMIKTMLGVEIALTLGMILAVALPLPLMAEFAVYFLWTLSIFFTAGLTIGNLNALALEPMGHIAGLATSIMAAVSTVGAVMIAVPFGLMFNGTPVPAAIGVLLCAVLGLWLTTQIVRDSDPL